MNSIQELISSSRVQGTKSLFSTFWPHAPLPIVKPRHFRIHAKKLPRPMKCEMCFSTLNFLEIIYLQVCVILLHSFYDLYRLGARSDLKVPTLCFLFGTVVNEVGHGMRNHEVCLYRMATTL